MRENAIPPGIGLRPATAADSEFCFSLHRAAMGEYVAAVWGWEEQTQREYHDRGFDPGSWQIVTADGADIGMLHVDGRPAEMYLARIEILPGWQGRGIGTALIRALIDQAGQHGQDLVLDVLAVNDRARALYRRLGMTEQAVHSGGTKITMRLAARTDRQVPEPA